MSGKQILIAERFRKNSSLNLKSLSANEQWFYYTRAMLNLFRMTWNTVIDER